MLAPAPPSLLVIAGHQAETLWESETAYKKAKSPRNFA